MIRVENLTKTFGATRALDGFAFHAEDGRVTGLLGPNGAGKTTALRILYGVMQPDAPDSGGVAIDGRAVSDDREAARRAIGVLTDVHGLYPRLTAREHVRYFGRLHGLGGRELERRIEALAEKLDMGPILDRRAAGFSHGERMKTALARALVHEPRNLVLDEPTNGLDVMSVRALREMIRGLRDEGRCVVFSSHVMQEVSALCDRIVIVARGRAVADGTPDELGRRYGGLEDAFVALTGEEVRT